MEAWNNHKKYRNLISTLFNEVKNILILLNFLKKIETWKKILGREQKTLFHWKLQTKLLMPSLRTMEALIQRCSVKKVFLEISQNSHANTCARVSLLKKRLWHRCFPVNFVKSLRTPFLTEHLWWLFLKLIILISTFLLLH